jgi:hypothetical protein
MTILCIKKKLKLLHEDVDDAEHREYGDVDEMNKAEFLSYVSSCTP